MPSLSLQGIYIEKYGTIRQQYLELDSGLNVLYGLNGAGKSQILDCVTKTICNDSVFAGLEFDPWETGNPILASLVFLPGRAGASHRKNSSEWMFGTLPSTEDILEVLLGHGQIGIRAESEPTATVLNLGPNDLGEFEKIIRETISDGLLALVPVPSRNTFQIIYCVKKNSESNTFQDTWRNLREAMTRVHINYQATLEDGRKRNEIWSEELRGQEHNPLRNSFTLFGSLRDPSFNGLPTKLNPSLDNEGLLHWPMPFVPIASLGFIKSLPVILIDESKDESLERLSGWLMSKLHHYSGENYLVKGTLDNDRLVKFSADLSNSVNRLLQSFMFGLPKANLDLETPDSSMLSLEPTWTFSMNDRRVLFEHLSNVQKRFCRLAIGMYQNLDQMGYTEELEVETEEPDEYPVLLLVDEPESGLNRTSEDFLAQGFANLAGKHVHSLVASHSPSFLNVDKARINLIEMSNSGTTIKPLIMPDIRNLSSLGLRPGDLLQMHKVFWLVEGEHELRVFEELFRDELEKYKIKILPLRGVKSLASVADSSMLFEYTNAKILVTVDNLQNAKLNSAWTSAKEMMKNKQPVNKAVGDLRRNLDEKTAEVRNLLELMSSSIYSGNWDRLEFSSLTKKDLIEYFAPKAFNLNSDWATLRSQHDSQKNRYPDFKEFLRVNNGAHISTNALVEACKTLDAIDPDWTECLKTAIKLSESQQ
jgi:energy-coupling factor transporter ATP-binding protein EcfA2